MERRTRRRTRHPAALRNRLTLPPRWTGHRAGIPGTDRAAAVAVAAAAQLSGYTEAAFAC